MLCLMITGEQAPAASEGVGRLISEESAGRAARISSAGSHLSGQNWQDLDVQIGLKGLKSSGGRALA